jgi:putative nucleotidyltransferase with HDIG domain
MSAHEMPTQEAEVPAEVPMDKEVKFRRIMNEVKSFPGMPETAARLLPLLESPDSDASQIEDILRFDPGLTANILKLTNSAYFGIPSKVSSVRQAIMLLGWKRLIQMVLTMCMSPVMRKAVPGYDLPNGELWRHSVAASVAAEVLVKSLRISDGDEVFTAALLHDVGKLVMGRYVREDLGEIEKMASKGISFEVAEYIVLGTDHAEIGANILKQWSFPIELVNAVQWHHDPDSCNDQCVLSDIVHTANVLGLMVGYGKGRNHVNVEPAFEVIDRLGLNSSQLNRMADETLERVQQLIDVMA